MQKCPATKISSSNFLLIAHWDLEGILEDFNSYHNA